MFNARAMAMASALCLMSAQGWAATLTFHADMKPGSEVPPNGTSGSGTVEATYDPSTHTLDYTLVWSGLSGAATMAHFHGPAPAGKNAAVVVPLGMKPTSPLKGTKVLTEAEAKQLEGGLWYANVHTAANPKGEIRGQVTQTK
jgi:hypothetical protein